MVNYRAHMYEQFVNQTLNYIYTRAESPTLSPHMSTKETYVVHYSGDWAITNIQEKSFRKLLSRSIIKYGHKVFSVHLKFLMFKLS